MKRRVALLVLAGAVALVVGAGVAFAKTVHCQGGMTTLCVGTDKPDKLLGTTGADGMNARQDDDVLRGYEGPDIMQGDTTSAQDDTTDGNDQLYGNVGDDWLLGYGGSDLLMGGGGADEINASETSSANEGEDTVLGGHGADSISAWDAVPDTIDCGASNRDVVVYDAALDEISNCEFLEPRPQ